MAFAGFTREQLQSFAVLLLVCLKNNPLFPNLPVKYADLEALVNAYQQAMVAAALGGPKDTAVLNETYAALIAALRQTAGYVQSLGLTNESDVLSSGFDIILPGRNPSTPLATPVLDLDNSVTGQLTVDLGAVANAKAYHVQYAIKESVLIRLAGILGIEQPAVARAFPILTGNQIGIEESNLQGQRTLSPAVKPLERAGTAGMNCQNYCARFTGRGRRQRVIPTKSGTANRWPAGRSQSVFTAMKHRRFGRTELNLLVISCSGMRDQPVAIRPVPKNPKKCVV